MSNNLVFMFSGQGSQYYKMGESLYKSNEVFRSYMKKSDVILMETLGLTIDDILYAGNLPKHEPFVTTRYSHPALFIIQYALAKTLIELGLHPAYLLGASLGEFVALVISGVLSFEQALRSVITQATMIEHYCSEARMLAVIAEAALFKHSDFDNSFLAAINFSKHFVITADVSEADKLTSRLNEKQIMNQLIVVSHGFHSPLIDNAKLAFLNEISSIELQSMNIPIISSVYGDVLNEINHLYLWEVVRAPIQFQQGVAWLENKGSFTYIDIGPSCTLATFLKYQLSSSSRSMIKTVLSPYEKQLNLEQWVEEFQ